MASGLSVPISVLVGCISLGYILFSGYLLSHHQGIGVRSLCTFTAFWGGNFLLSAVVIYAFAGYGITDGTQLTQLQSSVPADIQPVLASEAFFSGLFSVGAIFAWLWFVLRYTRRIGRREKTIVAIIGGGTLLVAVINGLIGAAATFDVITIQPSMRGSITEFATVIEILGTSVAIGVGTALLYATATQHRPFRERTVVAVVIPILPPWLIGHLYQFGLVTAFETISALRAITLGIGLGGLWLAVSRYDLFDQLPASRAVGRQTAFDSSDTAIVVVNNADNVSDLNPAARELFSTADNDPIGSPLESLLPERVDTATTTQPEGSSTFRVPNSDTVVEVTTTTATNESGQAIGRTMVFSDITTERRRQQRIQVLNRVLRHNLRNDLNAAKGYINIMTNNGTDTKQYQKKVERIIDDLVTIGNKAQNTEKVLAAESLSSEPILLSNIIDDAISSVESEFDMVPVTVTVPAKTAVRINPLVFRSIIEELIENAVRHGNCSEIRINYDSESCSLSIADDGSGIPDHEIAVLEQDQETDLQHGSGLGLWLIKWGTDSFGGSVIFDSDETGSEVKIIIPDEIVSDG